MRAVARGEKHYRAKLTAVQVQDMRDRYNRQQPRVTVAQLAEEHGVRYYTAWCAIHRSSWASVRDPAPATVVPITARERFGLLRAGHIQDLFGEVPARPFRKREDQSDV